MEKAPHDAGAVFAQAKNSAVLVRDLTGDTGLKPENSQGSEADPLYRVLEAVIAEGINPFKVSN